MSAPHHRQCRSLISNILKLPIMFLISTQQLTKSNSEVGLQSFTSFVSFCFCWRQCCTICVCDNYCHCSCCSSYDLKRISGAAKLGSSWAHSFCWGDEPPKAGVSIPNVVIKVLVTDFVAACWSFCWNICQYHSCCINTCTPQVQDRHKAANKKPKVLPSTRNFNWICGITCMWYKGIYFCLEKCWRF